MHYDCILPAPDSRRLYVVRDGDRWVLPRARCEEGWVADAVGSIQSQFRERYRAEVVVLRELGHSESGIVCELECLSSPAMDDDAAWLDPSGAANESLSLPQREAVRRWCDGLGGERRLAPWQRPGWYTAAREWIEGSAARAGLGSVLDLRQVKGAWNGSSVLEVGTSSGTCFFKASPARPLAEGAVIRALASHWRDHVPHVLAADGERNWMLMREASGEPLDAEDPEALAKIGRLIARIQLDQAKHVGRWLEMGCADRGLETLSRRLPRILGEIPRGLFEAGVIDADERDQIASFLPRARAIASRLAESAIPCRSIHHEDMRDGNVLVTEDGDLVIIDWNDVVVSHPFFTLHRFLWFMDPPDEGLRHRIGGLEEDALRRTLVDAYLEPYGEVATPEHALEAFELSCALAPLYDALRFDATAPVDEVLLQGLQDDEAESARELMDQVLEVIATSDDLGGA